MSLSFLASTSPSASPSASPPDNLSIDQSTQAEAEGHFREFPTWTATAPSNIALQKYWGKRNLEQQWPANDSLSMTLTKALTMTTAKRTNGSHDVFYFQGLTLRSDLDQQHKVFRHIQRLREELGVSGFLEIHSRNTFPADCGIASSASGFAALTLSVVASLLNCGDWEALALLGVSRERMAHWARQGSGSAGRSLFGGFVHWAAGTEPENQTITEIYPQNHWALTDIIVVLSKAKKSMSSSSAHLAAWSSPLFAIRLAGLPERFQQMLDAIHQKNINLLGQLIESDCLEMHGVAMTGNPAAVFFEQETIEFIAAVRRERASQNLPVWFTIDAGPNPHLICETHRQDDVIEFINRNWPNAELIIDAIGVGPSITQGDALHA
ncbi:MAG: diphosphomevalonate decarboxylase [Proteobacteria bacterium]|nr:diphosphomevalonate decarboxylase [Pseudomonadota bacterium]